jgi:signal peptidase I
VKREVSRRREEREKKGILRDYGLAIGGSILVALFVRFFVLEAYRMPSRAMAPAIEPGDTLFVSKFSYGFRFPGASVRMMPSKPKYGDVVVLEFPDEPNREYIKRVVGLPGDRIQILKGHLLLNGKPAVAYEEKPVAPSSDLCSRETLPNERAYEVCIEPPPITVDKELVVPEGNAFVVGDLRTAPFETRRLKASGLAPFEGIKGRALFVWLSIQPPGAAGGDWFSRIRFERLFHKIR